MVNLADLALSLDASFRSLGNVSSTKKSQMGSIQLGSDITLETSPLSMLTEGSRRYSTGISLPRSSYEAMASLAKASAREFSVLGTCLT